jgi:hypothetical protein
MAAKKGPNVLFRMQNRTTCILLFSVMFALGHASNAPAVGSLLSGRWPP